LDIKSNESLFKTHYKSLCNFANRYLEDKDEAEEVVQDVFVKIWNNKTDNDFHTNTISYLFSSVKNSCLNHIKHLSVRAEHQAHVMHHQSEEYSSSIGLFELEHKISSAMNALPEKCREVFIASRYEGLKHKEIADKYAISIKTVENQMGKALKHFTEQLRDYLVFFIGVFFLNIN
jgi:RNA polymerase sigma-70 factor, ECF subfamily